MYTIPTARTYNWGTYCGIPGGIPARTTIYQTMTTANTPAQINTAIAACPSGQVVALAAGTYNFGSTRITEKSGVTLRGAGPGSTIINSSGVQILRYDGSAFSDATYNTVSSGYTAGSTAIVLSSAPHAYFVAGSLVCITEAQSPDKFATGIGDYARDGLTDGAPSLNGSRCFRYVSRIASVAGNTINLATPIPLSFTASLTVRAFPMNIAGVLSQFGVEDMTFDGCSDPVLYYTSDRCWFKNVEFDNCAGCDQGHIIFHNGFQNEVRRCFIHDVPGWPVITEGMGIGVGYGTCNSLFIDNVTRRTSSAFIIYGSAANAIVYNYAMDCTRANDPPGVVMPFIFYHGPQGLMNLVEGNIGPGYCPDGYHGSASHDTVFRNHMNGLCTGRYADRRVMNLSRGSYYINCVGNILGDASWNPTAYEGSGTFAHTDGFPYVLGYPNSGNSSMTPETTWSTFPGSYPDAAVESTLIRHANYDYYTDGVAEWADADHTIADSLFYAAKPSFFGSLTWPAIDPFTPTANQNPAKYRWDTYAVSADLDDLFADAPIGTYWVSPTGTASWQAAESATPLAGTACCSLATANSSAHAGDTVYLRAGTYTGYINPANSGTAGNVITFARYAAEVPNFVVNEAGGRWAIKLTGVSYIKVDGITSTNSGAFYRIGYGSCYNEIANCTFIGPSTTEYSTALITWTNSAGAEGPGSDHNWIHDCTFTNYGYISACNDGGTIRISSDGNDPTKNNTISDCVFAHGGHDNIDIGGMYNVISGNVLRNDESYFVNPGGCPNDPASGYFGNRGILLSNSGDYVGTAYHNLIERNRIGHTGTPPDDDGSFGIENAGCHTIIRHNYVYNTAGSGIYFKAQPTPVPGIVLKSGSWGRVYNNTLYHTGYGDAAIDSTYKQGMQFWHYYEPSYWPWPADVQVKNNIVYDHAGVAFYETGGAEVTYANNYELDPSFIDTTMTDKTSLVLPDLRVEPASPVINAGTYLTQASGAGTNSVTLVVDDAMYFQDGTWGSSLAGHQADQIAIGTVENTVAISSINYTTNTITLSAQKSWADNSPVWLYKNSAGEIVLKGGAPDIGADEHEAGVPVGFSRTEEIRLIVSANEVARLYVEQPKKRAVAGTSVAYAVHAEPWNGFTGNITLDMTGLPSGATDSYSTNPITETGSSVATVTTTGVAAGTYSMRITGTSAGGDVASVRVLLEIVASADADIKVPIRYIRAKQGDDAVFTVEADALAGYTSDVNLSVAGVPSGATSAFGDASLAYNGTTTLTVDTGTAAVGTYELIITGEAPA